MVLPDRRAELEGGQLPRGIFMHIFGYWRSSRNYLGPAPDSA